MLPARPSGLRTLAPVGALLVAALGCGGADTPFGVRAVASIAFPAPSDTVRVGATRPLAVSVRDGAGRPLPATPRWSIADSTVAGISTGGAVTGRRAGETVVTARSGARSATLRLVVLPPPVARIELVPTAVTLAVGQGVQLHVVLRDAAGRALDARPVEFRSTNTDVATVDGGGLVRARSAGTTTAVVEVEGRVAAAAVRVTPPAATDEPAPEPPPRALPPPPLTTPPGDGSYAIRVVWDGAPDPRAAGLVDAALARWRTVITGDLPDVTVEMPADACFDGQPAGRERVDDLLVFVRVVRIDGAGGTLARAGPCYVRSGSGLPVVGLVELDDGDLDRSPATVEAVLLHEFGHVLGIGTTWGRRGLLHGRGGGDPLFLGETAESAYFALGGGTLVPVENSGGTGTRDGHWRESVFRTELMTGWINAGTNPMSRVTIASLRDLGYAVNLNAADAYALPGPGAASPRLAGGGGGVEVVDELILPTYTVDAAGRVERIRGR